jgi:hypothetical protein
VARSQIRTMAASSSESLIASVHPEVKSFFRN